jgi:hypothetical protein
MKESIYVLPVQNKISSASKLFCSLSSSSISVRFCSTEQPSPAPNQSICKPEAAAAAAPQPG